MNGKQLSQRPIKVIVVPDCEKENCPPSLTSHSTLGRQRTRMQIPIERVFRDITQSVAKDYKTEVVAQDERPGVFCRV